jgi:hypothetical protein
VNDPTKKSDIIFEVPKAQIPPSIRALMAKAEERMKAADAAVGDLLGEPLEIYLHIKNDKVLFSMPGPKLAAPALAKAIIHGVQEYTIENMPMPPKEFVSSRVGQAKVKYEHYVCFDWKQKKILTNFTPAEGQAFFGALAIVVEELQGGSSSSAEEKS